MADSANTGIYEIVNLANGKRYVGSAINLASRWRQHRCELGNGRHNPILQNAWKKYGETAFEFRVIEVVSDIRQLIEREQHYIDTLKPQYNCARIAGSNLGVTRSVETRAKDAVASKRLWSDPDHRERMAAAHRGKTLSAEQKAKIGAAHRGRKLNPEHAAKVAASNAERNKTPEQRAATSAFHKGRKKTEEQKAKISASKTARPLTLAHRAWLSQWLKDSYATGKRSREKSQEHKNKISKTLKGRPLTPEHLRNVRKANSRPWSDERRRNHSAGLRAAWAAKKARRA